MNPRKLDLLLLRLVDAGLVAAIFAVPLALGGRIAAGQLILVTLAIGVAACWSLRQALVAPAAWIHSPAEAILAAALVWVGLQLTPLAPAAISTLSPHLYETLPLWAPRAASPTLGAWSTLSFTPAATRAGLILLLAFVLLFLTTVQRIRRIEDVERLLRGIAVSTVVMAVFALVQYLAGNGLFFWIYEHPFARTDANVLGSFTNRNHFAQFIALGVGPLVWWVHEGLRRRPVSQIDVGLRMLGLGVSVFAGLMSLSRGGAAALFAASVVCLFVLYRADLVSRKTLLAMAGAGLLVAAALGIYGYESVANRLNDFSSIHQLDRLQLRRLLWQADAAAVAQYPLAGTGLGSHSEIYPLFLPNNDDTASGEFTHAENSYLQVCLEGGVPGLVLALAALGLCGWWCLAALRSEGSTRVTLAAAAIAGSLAASALHAVVDFIWYVPGCMVALVILAACACRLRWPLILSARRTSGSPLPAGEGDRRTGRFAWLAVACILLGLGGVMVQDQCKAVFAEAAWFRYLKLAQTATDPSAKDRPRQLKSMADELTEVVRWQPEHLRAHAQLAAIELELFDTVKEGRVSPLDVRQVREAVLASQFPTPEAMNAWLARAFGPRLAHLDAALRHARQALALCPLRGEVYLYLADLSFLGGRSLPDKRACTAQALRVRPYDGAVLFAAGQESALAGDLPQALVYWRASFACGTAHQERLFGALAGQVSIEFLLDTFRPDAAALKRLTARYRTLNRPAELPTLLGRYAEASQSQARHEEGPAAARTWLDAAAAYRDLTKTEEAIGCLRQAVQCDGSCYDARELLGEALLQSRHFDEAEGHLHWCLQRRPGDTRLQQMVEQTVDGRLRTTATPSSGRF